MPIISMIQRVADPLSHPVLFPIDHGQRFVINHRSAVSPPPLPRKPNKPGEANFDTSMNHHHLRLFVEGGGR